MIDLNSFTAFVGWCALINMSLLAVMAISVAVAGEWMAGIHASMYRVSPERLPEIYFNYLAHFKLVVLIFNITPYVALKLIQVAG